MNRWHLLTIDGSAASQADGQAADTHDIRELYPNDYGEITGESLDIYLEAAEQSRKQAHDYANGQSDQRPEENVGRYWASRDGLTDTVSGHVDEMDLADYVAYQIGTGKSKLKWKDQEKGTGRTHGLGGHLGLSGSSAERKARRAFIDDKNGLWPEEYAELLYANMPEGLRARYSDRDVLNAVLDVMRGASSRVGIMQDLASRWGSGETLEQRIERERDEWDRQQEEDMREQQEVDEQMRRDDVAATEGAEAVVDADYADLIADAQARLNDPNASEFEKQAARAVLRFRQRDGRGGASAQGTEGGDSQPLFRLRGEEKKHVERSNKRFNEELNRQITGQLSQGHIYNLGRASSILQSAGFPDADIELSSTRLAEKARQHGFGIDDVRNLVSALQEPVAVFSYGDKTKAQNVIAEIVRDGKNFVVGVHFNQSRHGAEVSDIRGLFPKDNAEWLNWVSQGKLLYVDKEKIQTLIDQQRTNPAEVDYLDLEDVAKIIKDFENPSVLSENNSKTTENSGISQGFGSAETSLNQVASAMRKIDWKPGTVNVDIGGGRFDKATEYLREQGVESMVFDPFNRDAEHNRQVAERVRDEKVDTVTCNNVLNVIDSASSRANVILQAAKALKPGGTAYFSVYEGDKSGVGRQTKSDSWQNNRVTKDYVSEIERYFDDVTVKGKVIIAKNPKATAEQSVWDFDGTYSGNDVRFRVRDDERRPTFYSNAERAVENVKQGKATAEQWKAMLTKAGGIKAGEDKWMGLTEWLDEHKGQSLTKDDVLQFVRDNGIEMREVNYGDAIFSNNSIRNLEGDIKRGIANGESIEDVLSAWDNEFGDTKLEEYRAGRFEISEDGTLTSDEEMRFPVNSTRLNYTTRGLENKREIAFVVDGIEPYQQYDEIHFGPENAGKAVMWVRFGETRDKGGNRVLVIDEVQSNRHQDARERGYKGNVDKQKEATLKEHLLEIQKEMDEINDKMKNTNLAKNRNEILQRLEEIDANVPDVSQRGMPRGNMWLKDNRPELWREKGELKAEERRLMTVVDNELRELQKQLDLLEEEKWKVKDELSQSNAVPDAPFEKNWMEVAMKRMLRLAAEEGFDKVAWTTGAQQAERYGIGGVVESITKGKTRGENTLVSVQYKNGKHDSWVVAPDGKVVDGGITTGENLSDLIGKELSEKVMSLDENGSISGDGLRIGGEGMKGFYDQIVPSFMRKYVKKWGSQVGEVELATPGGEVMHSVDVTEPMRDSVLEGQPLFRVRDEARQYDEQNGTELSRFVEFLERGRRLLDGENNHFHVGNTGDILNRFGISGKITVSTTAVNKRHTNDSDHLTTEEWVKAISNINNPLAITKYGNQGKSFRIYTLVQKNGKNICVGVDVNNVGRDVNVTNVRTAFARDIVNALNESLLYPSRGEFERAIQEFSSRHNREIYPEQPLSGSKGSDNSSISKINEEKTTGNGVNYRVRDGHEAAVEDARRRLESDDASEFERQAARAVIKAYGGGDDPDTPDGGGPRFRVREPQKAIEDYERAVNSSGFQVTEALQDSMMGLKKLMQAIVGKDAKGKEKAIQDIAGFENAYLKENRLQSESVAQVDEYRTKYYSPLVKAVSALCPTEAPCVSVAPYPI